MHAIKYLNKQCHEHILLRTGARSGYREGAAGPFHDDRGGTAKHTANPARRIAADADMAVWMQQQADKALPGRFWVPGS